LVSEAIERIREAEKQAEDIAGTARAAGKKALADAHEAAEKMLEEMRRSARTEERGLIDAAAEEAESFAASLTEEGRAEVVAVRTEAEKRVSEGIKKVLDAITAAT
jgi:vacuolar-type H+-ATPase subunit H